MVFFFLGLNQDIIDICIHNLMHLVMENDSHCTLIGCPIILKPKWHDCVTEGAPRRGEGCLGLVTSGQLDLIISRISIHKGEHGMTCRAVDQEIDVGEWIVILWSSFVEISKVDTNSNFTIFLGNCYNIC